jgi:hypothetical protein
MERAPLQELDRASGMLTVVIDAFALDLHLILGNGKCSINSAIWPATSEPG